ncbi:MAG: LuxR C-terminal-related transcriptional regulator [Pseudonocardia sp.]
MKTTREGDGGAVTTRAVRNLPVAARHAAPHLAATLLPRPRLVGRMLAEPRPPVVVVSAPAGWGKTTLVAQAAAALADAGAPVAWVTVSPADDAHALWTHVIEALRSAVPQIAGPLSEIEVLTSPAGLAGTVDRLLAIVESGDIGVTIVLDDVHRLADVGSMGTLERCVELLPENLRLLMTARHDPHLPLHRWRMNDVVTDVRAADLAATDDEASALFDRLGLDLGPDDVAVLQARTEGWIGGLRLASRAILASDDPCAVIGEITGTTRAGGLAAYLIEQVLADLDEPTRVFLGEIAVLESVPVELAARISGRADALGLLRELSAMTGFVAPVDADESEYRCHQLLAAAALRQVTGDDPARAERLHRVAARWYAERDRVLEALRHAVAAGDGELTRELLLTHVARLIVSGRVPAIRALLRGAPPELVREDPALAAVDLATRAWAGDFTTLDEVAPVIEVAAAGEPDPARAAWMSFAATMAPVARDRVRGDYGAIPDRIAHTERLLARFDLPGQVHWEAVMASNAATAALWSGDVDGAIRLLGRAAATMRRIGPSLPALNALGLAGWPDLLDGRLDAAEAKADEAEALATRLGWTTTYQAAAAFACRAAVAVERADPDAAERHLARAEAAAQPFGELAIAVAIGGTAARLLTARGQPGEALATLHTLRLDPRTAPTTPILEALLIGAAAEARAATGDLDGAAAVIADGGVCPPSAVTLYRARAAVEAGDPLAAMQLLSAPAARPAPGRLLTVEVRRLLWTARACQLVGRRERALHAAREALDLTGQHGFGAPWRELGRHARPLLTLLEPGENGRRAATIATLLTTLPAVAPTDPGGGRGVPRLTPREQDLVVLLPTRMTNDEIAAMLHLSTNTVKTHLRSLYRKLGVDSRGAAIARAEQAGML